MRGGLDVVVADEDWLVRLGLISLLSADERFGHVVEVGTAASALAAVHEIDPTLLITDVRLPDGSGIDLCRQVRAQHPETQVLCLTGCCDEDLVIGAMLAGARGYLLKNNDPERLLANVKTVALGGSVFDAPGSDLVLRWMRRAAVSPRCADRINEHERKILSLIAEGKTNREIAAHLYLSEHTVKTYVSGVLKKLQLGRRAEAAAYVARQERYRAS
jgi:two-component system response regulator DevR